ncbi:MAG: NADH-quinone oxidoreductase subunit D [Dehalococcoidia bacterium]
MDINKKVNDSGSMVDMLINMGPQHPSTHGVFRLVLQLDGELIVDAEPHIGYLHRGSEKLCEAESYSQVVTLFDRLDYVANLNGELAFCMAVEKLLEVEIPDRAWYIRTILCELNRIASHMLFYGVYGLDAGAMTPVLYGFRERERIQSLFEQVTGARMMHNYIRIGGVKEDLPPGFDQKLSSVVNELDRAIEECDELLTQNETFLARTKNVSCLTIEDAVNFGVTGPILRSTGLIEDVRISEPYGIYDRFDFGIPIGSTGDCWDRYYVRMLEMRESLSIIKQAMKQMEPGEVQAKMRRIVRPPEGECFVRTESPRGDLGVFLVSDGSQNPYRVKVRAPSFANLQAIKHMLEGVYVADAVVILGSLDIVLGEVDR